MSISRRDLSALLPLLAAAQASAQQPKPAVTKALLPGTVYHDKALQYEGDDKKKGRRFFRGVNRNGFDFRCTKPYSAPACRPILHTNTPTKKS